MAGLLVGLFAVPVCAAPVAPQLHAPITVAAKPAPQAVQKTAAAVVQKSAPKIAAPIAQKPAAPKSAAVVASQSLAITAPAARTSATAALIAHAPLTATLTRRAVPAGPRPQMIPIEAENGAYIVPVLVNGVLPLKFIVDSGSADVSIPAEVAFTLKQMGTMTGTDFLGKKTYQLADGSLVSSEIYKVASLKIGGLVMHDVTVRISAEKSSLLLGQSFLRRLTSWSMDNAKKVLIITGGA